MRKIVVLITLLVLANISAQQKGSLAFGPFIQQMTTKSATICWVTYESTPSITYPDGNVKPIREYKQHSIHLARLNPNTKYTFDVLNNGTDIGKGSFTTYPDKITPFKFCVFGDTRSRHKIHTRIVNRIINEKPLFVINTGDMIGNGRDINDWEPFFKINKELMRNIPYYPVLGNHEKDSPYYFDFFDLPNNEKYYHFSVGDALFIVLDSEGEEISEPEYISKKNSDKFWEDSFKEYFAIQKRWLEKVLDINKEAGFVFVFQHHPMYSIKKSRVEETNRYRKKLWGDFFEKHKVQVFFNGHDHHYHHAYKNGVHFITTAGGGAGLYETDAPQPETVKYKKIEHFVSVSVNKNNAVLNVIDINGNQIDKITVDRRSSK